jgi:hypothetical protein
LVDHPFDEVVHLLRPFALEHGESLELSFKELHLGYVITFVGDLLRVLNFFGALQPIELVVLLYAQRSKEYRDGL